MLKNCLFLFCIVLVCSSYSVPPKVMKKADKVISKFYDIEDFSKEILTVSETANAETITNFNNGNFFKITIEGEFKGYGFVGNAPSKTARFDYLVLFDTNFIITKSKVLVYREEYGGEIGSKRWLKQFNGASSTSAELKYNQDIIPISGATISVRSMTNAMNNLLQCIGKLQELNEL